jgi:hypothetical protein
MKINGLSLLALSVLANSGLAEDITHKLTTPFQFALAAPVQLFNEHASTAGLRINILYGRSENVAGIDVGVVNHATDKVAGLQLGVANIGGGEMSGIQASAFNKVYENAYGWQSGAICTSVDGNGAGLQTSGILNQVSKTFRGLQVGLVNIADELHGVQIGLLNFNRASNYFSFFPFINVSL